MKNLHSIPDNLQMNIKNSLDFYKKFFGYKNVLLIQNVEKKLKVICQTNNKRYKKYVLKSAKINIKEVVNYSDLLSKQSILFKICSFYHAQILIYVNENYLVLIENQNSTYTDQEKLLGNFFAQYLNNLINSEKLVEDLELNSKRLQQMISEITALHEISRALDSGRNLDALLQYIMEKCKLIMIAEAASLMLVIPETKELEFKIVLGPKSEEVRPFKLPIGQGISGWVAKTGKPVLIPDAYNDDRFDPTFDKRSGFKTRSMLCVPMIYKNKTIGVMTVLNRLDQFSFTENDQLLLSTFASQAALAIENAKLLIAAIEQERLHKELQVAAEIQSLLIPQTLPKIDKLEISATYLPCQEISGDFYDIIKLPQKNKFAIVVADVSGKGIPGAMVVSNMQATLRAYLEQKEDLLDIVSSLNTCIINQTTDDRFITFFIGIFNQDEMTLEYVNAGHNPPLHFTKADKIEKLKAGGIFIGIFPYQYKSDKIQLQSGDILVLYTDGLVEAMNNNDEEFGEAEVIKIVEKSVQNSSRKIQQKLIDGVKKHIGERALNDDFTLVVIKIR